MRQVNSTYSQSFIGGRRRVRHALQRRCRLILVNADRHLTELQHYIVLRRVCAGVCCCAGDQRWGSSAVPLGDAEPLLNLCRT